MRGDQSAVVAQSIGRRMTWATTRHTAARTIAHATKRIDEVVGLTRCSGSSARRFLALLGTDFLSCDPQTLIVQRSPRCVEAGHPRRADEPPLGAIRLGLC